MPPDYIWKDREQDEFEQVSRLTSKRKELRLASVRPRPDALVSNP